MCEEGSFLMWTNGHTGTDRTELDGSPARSQWATT
jgi:hypothetical protein